MLHEEGNLFSFDHKETHGVHSGPSGPLQSCIPALVGHRGAVKPVNKLTGAHPRYNIALLSSRVSKQFPICTQSDREQH